MLKILTKVGLFILCAQATWVLGQNISKDHCGDFRKQLAKEFLNDKPADSLVLVHYAKSPKFLEFYKGLGEDGKLSTQLNVLTGIDSFGLAFKELVEKQYMDTYFTPFNGKVFSTGEKVQSPQKGNITVINTWFTRCKPCVEEMPALNELKKKYGKDEKVKFIAIARDQNAAVEAFLKTHEFTYDVVVDEKGKIMDTYCISLYPTNIVIDQNGLVRYFQQGTVNIDDMVATIEQLKK